ncbi:Fimbrial biogenesis outer membrane usher protein [Lysobacter dokdonensis DS-58]|uniref:Fimbrial biogenesis outer membrane usher protein n=1 Tax=Lysobacter dokdonensis DS-58 TaxID=1300345 RepID=A0A0A2WR14_9GAMM|nr:fimbria/pilus outer membrane usher protein [Lysobacter dokdonensis]KGQ20725.1 Fimbrial biogenesis outer membrane usher protein [Lysobacter dokdonensis DS-58]
MKRGPPAFALAIACAAAHAAEPAAPRVRFDASMLRNARGADVAPFESAVVVRAGLHDVEVMRNGDPLGRRGVRFEGDPVAPCFDGELVAWLGVSAARLTDAQRDRLAGGYCASIASLHPAASVRHDAGERTLDVSIPQALLATRSDAIDPATLDAGITAFRLGYAANLLHHETRDGPAAHRGSVRLDAGANIGAWRWRHRTMHAWGGTDAIASDVMSASLERDVSRFDASLTVGDFQASGLLLDSLALRGVRFQSDDRMLPASQSRPAPVIRGVADTNARIHVRQGGRLLFDTTVPPGPFDLADVQPQGQGGDLDVHVEEADGRRHSFRVPYWVMPGLLRAGRKRFGLTAGRLRGAETWEAPVVAGALEAGVRDRLTVRAGAQATSGHAEALLGVVFGARAGAMSIDRLHGHDAATRATFTTGVASRSTLQLSASHRPRAFRTLQDALAVRTPSPLRERRRIDATLHATSAKRRHGMRMTFVDRRWHGTRAAQRSAQLGWSVPARRNGAVLHATVEHAQGFMRATSNHATIALSFPLQVGEDRGSAHVHARHGPAHSVLQSGVSGAWNARTGWNLGVTQSRAMHGTTTTRNAALSHTGSAGRVDAGLSASPGLRQSSLTFDGSALVHPHGITFGPWLGDTIALVRAEHGVGTSLLQAPGIRLDRLGHAVVPHLTPYRRNRVGIDVRDASPDVAFDWTERDVIPRAGAIVDVPLSSAYRPTTFVRIVVDDGQAPPFGARLTDAAGITRARVGRDGIARIPDDGSEWFLEGDTRPCAITPASADALAVATCPGSAR